MSGNKGNHEKDGNPKNTNQEQETAARREREREAYLQIMESLAGRFDVLYYVSLNNGVYTEFLSGEIYGNVEIKEEGNNFFAESRENARHIIHPEDQERVLACLDKDFLISRLDERKVFSTEYRLVIDGNSQMTRLTVMWANDRNHFVIGVENIEEEVRRKKEMAKALKAANEKAWRDELTGVKNKNAFREFQEALQRNIERGTLRGPFALVICDLNNLKEINDERGHKAGDDTLVEACRIICRIFAHSPVFRIGGDEFAAVLMEQDYEVREHLLIELQTTAVKHRIRGEGPVVASGMVSYDPEKYGSITEMFEEADHRMYENKKTLKQEVRSEEPRQRNAEVTISEFRKHYMDRMFEAFALVADADYVFLCDMKYDYSRWSKQAVEKYGLPSEYMYHVGELWQERIHPEDRDTYQDKIEAVFSGAVDTHDMQYRVRRTDGAYDVCTCRGIVLRDQYGEQEYFVGSIRDHGIQDHIDSMTGLRNQYGFLEDLQTTINRKQKVMVAMVGISRFSELNDVYGYQFGNLLLQKVGRYLYEHVGNEGTAYRLDGTKFAEIRYFQTEEEIRERYANLRAYFRDGFYIEDHYVILELNAGILELDSFDIDDRTAYACLYYAYSQSKRQKHGELVRFDNYLNDENAHQIEKIQAIRASIPRGYSGFFLAYQPVVDAKTEKLLGAEALLRWEDPVYGLVPPNEFIPVMESDSLFPELGRWILKTALLDAKQIMKAFPDFIIDVNLAYTQIERPGFADEVLGILKETEFPPEQLCLEITERCRLLDMDLLKDVVVKLQSEGIRISLDDFGTGFSSVGLMKELPLNTIKIDRSFVTDIEKSEEERRLIGSFVSIASLCGADVCVEGIETAGMRDLLREYPIQSFQGFFYARPLKFEDFLQWNEERKTAVE